MEKKKKRNNGVGVNTASLKDFDSPWGLGWRTGIGEAGSRGKRESRERLSKGRGEAGRQERRERAQEGKLGTGRAGGVRSSH